MKNKTKKLKKKDEIIYVATKLFYENGIKNTFFEQIAKECEVTAPLITYHFKTKVNLVQAVVQKYTSEIKNNVTEKIYNQIDAYDLQYSTAAEIIMNLRLYNEDEKAFSFYYDYLNCGFESQFCVNFIDYYKIHDRHYNLNIDRNNDEISMLSSSAYFSTLSLIYSYFTGRLNCSFDQFVDYTVSMPFKFMHIEDNQIKVIIEVSKQILEQLDLKIYPYFQIK